MQGATVKSFFHSSFWKLLKRTFHREDVRALKGVQMKSVVMIITNNKILCIWLCCLDCSNKSNKTNWQDVICVLLHKLMPSAFKAVDKLLTSDAASSTFTTCCSALSSDVTMLPSPGHSIHSSISIIHFPQIISNQKSLSLPLKMALLLSIIFHI